MFVSYMKDLTFTIRGTVLLLLAVAGNFIAETLSCGTQKLLRENMFAKHIITLFILYFAVDFANTDEPEHPFAILKTAGVIYLLFLFFTKMSLKFTIVAFSMLAGIYVLTTFIDYYKVDSANNADLIERLEMLQGNIFLFILGVIGVGAGSYFMKQYKDHKDEWSTFKFVFGIERCEHTYDIYFSKNKA